MLARAFVTVRASGILNATDFYILVLLSRRIGLCGGIYSRVWRVCHLRVLRGVSVLFRFQDDAQLTDRSLHGNESVFQWLSLDILFSYCVHSSYQSIWAGVCLCDFYHRPLRSLFAGDIYCHISDLYISFRWGHPLLVVAKVICHFPCELFPVCVQDLVHM